MIVIHLEKNGSNPKNKIVINGVDITRMCRGVHISSRADTISKVYLDLIPEMVEVTVEEGEIRLIKPKSV